jgi:thioredoxin-related protein
MAPFKLQQFLHRHQVSYPVLIDADYRVARKYRVQGTPTSYLINRAGKMLGGIGGPGDWDSQTARRLFTHLLAQSP